VSSGGQGHDYNLGGRGNDRWYGGPDPDTLTDFRGWDFISGGDGADSCLATWDGGGHDTIKGGAGRDIYYADNVDTVKTAERKIICFAE